MIKTLKEQTMDLLENQDFTDWSFCEISVGQKDLPTRIYFQIGLYNVLSFKIVELHGSDDADCELWDKQHSYIKAIGLGTFSHKGLNMELSVDHSATSKTLATIFVKLSEIDPHNDD
jgi:hypothetical protein